MPRKVAPIIEVTDNETDDLLPSIEKDKNQIDNLNRMLAAVLNYLSDEEIEEIDIEFLLTNTEGLREWWDQYRESNRKQIEEEIKRSLGELSLKQLESIRGQLKINRSENLLTLTRGDIDMNEKNSEYWIKNLGLIPHPEGGYYKSTYDSNSIFSDSDMVDIGKNVSYIQAYIFC